MKIIKIHPMRVPQAGDVKAGFNSAAAVALSLMLLSLAGCSPNGVSKSQAQAVINKGLVAASDCIPVPVGVEYISSVHSTSLALKTLRAQGLVQQAPVTVNQYIGPPKTKDGFVFNEAAKAIAVQRDPRPGFINPEFCVRSGKFEVASLEAIDVASDATGRLVATVRARVQFVPEGWIAKTVADPAWSSYWSGIKKTEETQWLYTLLKSGDQLFYSGRGQALK